MKYLKENKKLSLVRAFWIFQKKSPQNLWKNILPCLGLVSLMWLTNEVFVLELQPSARSELSSGNQTLLLTSFMPVVSFYTPDIFNGYRERTVAWLRSTKKNYSSKLDNKLWWEMSKINEVFELL